MYVQWFVKGISGPSIPAARDGLTASGAVDLIRKRDGIQSNWWRNKNAITPREVADVLTADNLERHLHDYEQFGDQSPFISLAIGCVERDILYRENYIWSAIDTALDFGTDSFQRPGSLFYGWTIVGLNPAIQIEQISEAVLDLNTYQRWSPYQLEGEVTAKINIPANQIYKVENWDSSNEYSSCVDVWVNPEFVSPKPITNVRNFF